MIVRIMSDIARAILNLAAIAAAMAVLAAVGLFARLKRWGR